MFPGLSTQLKNIALKFHVFLHVLHPTEGNGEKYKQPCPRLTSKQHW